MLSVRVQHLRTAVQDMAELYILLPVVRLVLRQVRSHSVQLIMPAVLSTMKALYTCTEVQLLQAIFQPAAEPSVHPEMYMLTDI